MIVAQLRKGGFDVTFKSPTNRGTLVATGEVDAFLDIPGGSVRDPYTTLSFDTTKLSAPTGQPAVQPYRWKNEQYDALLDELAKLPGSDPKFMQIYHQAMEIWIPNLPQIPLIQRYMFLPVNTTYWTQLARREEPLYHAAQLAPHGRNVHSLAQAGHRLRAPNKTALCRSARGEPTRYPRLPHVYAWKRPARPPMVKIAGEHQRTVQQVAIAPRWWLRR